MQSKHEIFRWLRVRDRRSLAMASKPVGGGGAAHRLERDLKTLVCFVEIFCRGRHKSEPRQAVRLKTHDLEALTGREVVLCSDCRKLLTHALTKRSACPMDPKPACKHCPVHCYHPAYRQRMREVMRYSGRKLVLGGRLDLLVHLLF